MTGNYQEADDMTETEFAAAEPSAALPQADEGPRLPPGEYAIVEIMGHQTLIGRVEEVTRFGAAMLQIEPIFAGELLPAILQGGAAIYRLTPCTAATAFERAPRATQRWALPDAIRCTLPPALIEPPEQRLEALAIDEGAFLGADDEYTDMEDMQ